MNAAKHRKPRILQVEDNLIVATAYERLLRENGCDVIHCATGEEAVDKLKAERFDLVLLDLILPGDDGVGVVRHAQVELWKHKTQTVVLTLADMPAVREELRKQGVTCILNKRTTKPEEVVEAVMKALSSAEEPVDTDIRMEAASANAEEQETPGRSGGRKGFWGRILRGKSVS